MNAEQAQIILHLIETATDSNWPETARALIESGFTREEVADATGALAEIAECSNPISAEHF